MMPDLQEVSLLLYKPPRLVLQMSSTGGGWAQLRQQARTLEQQVRPGDCFSGLSRLHGCSADDCRQTETLFHTYSQFGSTPNIPPKPSEEELRVETRLQEVLEQVPHATPARPRLG